MEVVVFGAGSLGSLVGGMLAREHDVTLVARRAHADAISRSGLRVEGRVQARVTPEATTDGRNLAADLVVVTVKSFDTDSAADTLETGSFDAILSLQNGMGNEERLAARLDAPVLAGTATYGAIRRDPGVVECTGTGEIVLGPPTGGRSERADRVGDAFSAAGLETTVADDMPSRQWEKLAVNAGINAVTALTATENGAVLEPPANDIARTAARETARVARGTDIDLSNRTAIEAIAQVAAETATNTSSMYQDVLADRRTEIDAINGYVVDKADRLGLEVPINRTLTALVRTWERGRGLR
ncbi:ketopantoate reductase family protein [Halopiger djelfimassiliensis]|uniref:ketopantoate reductase family protein n=1 Tax=Halopiger djelfimassiliensis TaxID=1293047 RepID=UPI000677A9C4|nr:ketopantoate reductase family protein [Halopiger djelfimassiliensis]